jgi:glutamate-1-semialdehyde-2,1-aminomutase
LTGGIVEKLQLQKSEELYAQAKDLIPGGVLGIRRPYNFVPGEYPIFVVSGKGGRITDVDGNEYIDLLCSYGPLILGHREEEVDNAVIEQIRQKGFCFDLVQPLQNQLAIKMRELIPCAEMSIFVKTGSDATTAAIRIARGHTGRLKVLRCGYHGWHDWCVEVKGGIPEKLWEDVHEFHYNDLDSLEKLLKEHKGNVAAVIITPVGHPLAHPVEAPRPGFLEGVRELTTAHGAVLIFDEIRTGFRVSMGGAQARYGVTPDLATFGKAMANGYPISAVVGRREVMSAVESKVFISSTFFPNSLEMVAALKTIEILERERVPDKLWARGQKLLDRLGQVVAASGVPCALSGIPPMPFITFETDPQKKYKDRRTLFYTEVIRRGVFLQPYHHGYICYRHTDEELDTVVGTAEEALAEVWRKV